MDMAANRVDHLTKERCGPDSREGVCRARGGESCAFDGAMIVLQPIADTAHLVHGPIACCGNSWEGRGTLSNKGTLHRMGFTTDLKETDIVYGAGEKLLDAIIQTNNAVRPRAIFVHATCVSGIMGEDIDAVCAQAEKELGIRVIPVNAPGFTGPKNLGNRIAGEVLLDHVIGTGEPPFCTDRDINLIGEYNIAGDLWNVEPLFEKAGIRVLSRITGNATFEEITYAHRAKLNVVVCGRALVNVAREMERRYGIPYLEVSFFGRTETTKALRRIGEQLDIRERVEAVIGEEESALATALEAYPGLKGKRAVLYTGGVKSWSFISALLDLGIEVAAVGTKKSTREDEEKMKVILGESAPLVEDVSPAELKRIMRERSAHMLIAGGRNLYLAMKEGMPFVDVNQERHSAYAGYRGLVTFARDISNSIGFFDHRARSLSDRSSEATCADPLQRAATINPLKHSPSIGAAIALQGIDGATAIIHGAQGCTFLGKVLITKHFREPIALQGTKVFASKLVDTIETVLEKQKPALVGILSTGLTEVKGDDIDGSLKKFGQGGYDSALINLSTPDYSGSLETGYAETLKEIAAAPWIIPDEKQGRLKGRVNVLAGPHLTPADFTEMRDTIESFGLDPVFLPDLAALDGSRRGFSALAAGGTTLDRIAEMGRSEFTIAVGMSMESPAEVLRKRFGVEYSVLKGLTGLRDTDTFLDLLAVLSGQPASGRFRRQRDVLADAMRDAHFSLSGRTLCLALDADHALQVSRFAEEMNAEVALAVVPADSKSACHIAARDVIVGDLFSIQGSFDLIAANSHAEDIARQLCIPHCQMGFPVYKVYGYTAKTTIGYRGTMDMMHEMANLMAGH